MKLDNKLLDLWNRSCVYDSMSEVLFLEKFTNEKDQPGSHVIVETDGDRVIGFILGVTRLVKEIPTGYVKLLAVDPEFQDQGYGSRLLSRLESAFAEEQVERVRVGESAPNYLVPGLDPRYTRAMVFFERRGYRRFGETWNLSVDLNRLKPVPAFDASKGIVRRATKVDKAVVMLLLEKHWPAWKPEIDRTFQNDPISLHIVTLEDAVIAFSAYDSNNVGTGWFGPMGTDPEHRGAGLGAVLLLRCLHDMKAQGLATSTIPWVGPIGFYCRHADAVVDRVFYRYEKQLE